MITIITWKDIVNVNGDIYAEEFEEANAASVETVSNCISIPSANKTTDE